MEVSRKLRLRKLIYIPDIIPLHISYRLETIDTIIFCIKSEKIRGYFEEF